MSTDFFGVTSHMAKPGRKAVNPEKRPGWARRITRAREELEISQEKLAELLGRSQSTIGEWEGGYSEPRLAGFAALAKALNVSPIWLTFGVGPDGKPDDSDPLALSMIERHKHDRLFGHVFTLAARMLAEEGLDSDLAYLVRYTQKISGALDRSGNDPHARELIAVEVEKQRLIIRSALEGLVREK
jgi:transcriptional regulator with XRE-family HTH domain